MNRATLSTLLGTLVLGVAVAGQAQAPTATGDVDRAEAMWREVAPREYVITLTVDAFYPGAGRPLTFRVTGDDVQTIGQSLEPGLLALYGRYNTVERLFRVIRDATSNQPVRRDLEFHPALGYPISINIDPRHDTRHDEIFVQVLDLRTDLPVAGGAPGSRQSVLPGRPTEPSVPAGPQPAVVASRSVVGVPMSTAIRDGSVSEFVALVPAASEGGRCEAFPVSFNRGERAVFYGFGPDRRPTRRVTIILDDRGNVLRYSDGRGDLRAPMDSSVSSGDPLGARTTIAIDWQKQTGVLMNTEGVLPPTGIRAVGPDVLVAANIGEPSTMVERIKAECNAWVR